MLMKNVRVNHRRRDFLVSEQILNRANVAAVLQQMRRKRMAKRVRAGVFRNAALRESRLKRLLQSRSRPMVPARRIRARIDAGFFRRKDELPRPFAFRIRILAGEGI